MTPIPSEPSTRIPLSRKPIIISGPSGTGKSTLLKLLFTRHPTVFGFSISHTTRAPRPNETPDVDYHFVPPSEFNRLVSAQAFLEHATFSSNQYGTTLQAVRDVEGKQGKICILDIEIEGVKQVYKKLGSAGARFAFVAPPSLEVLEERLRGRGTETEEGVRRRLDRARVELSWVLEGEGRGVMQCVVVNDDLERAYGELERWIFEGDGEGEGELG